MQIKEDWKSRLTDEYILELKTWDEVLEFIKANKKEMKNCIYRGQRNSSWPLEPSFFRKISSNIGWEKLQNQAQIHLANFQKFTRGRHGISYTDPIDSEENWWALGQHYGLETPLLDWVRSLYVATFFAFIEETQENEEPTRSVFILDLAKIHQILNNIRGGSQMQCTLALVDPLTHENKRLVSQQAAFTYINHYGYRTIEKYIEEFNGRFAEKINGEILLLKLTIPSTERLQILDQLDSMNINQSTLFPDLIGASKHCNYLLNIC